MNHPTPEQWMEYLYDEMPPAETKALDAHLESCGPCRQKKTELLGTSASLNHWQVVLPARRPFTSQWQPVAKWAAAAVLLATTAFATGRMTQPEIDLAAIQAQVSKPLEEKLQRAMRQEVQLASRLASERAVKQFQAELAANLKAATDKALAESAAHTRRQLEQLSVTLAAVREEDRKAVAAALQAIEEQRVTEYRTLRQDLERVALFTDESFRAARRQLVQLANYPQPLSEQ